jgi:hypothetical protein
VGIGEHTKKFAQEKEIPIMSLHRVKPASHLEAAKESKAHNPVSGHTP